MILIRRDVGGLPARALTLALALGIGTFSGSSVRALGLGSGPDGPGPKRGLGYLLIRNRLGRGTLGYGPPGLQPGFQGFGLGFHPGYGYGGYGLGVGALGGYPDVGGPGYPHYPPPLRRFGKLLPFSFEGGPGGPVPGHPNYYGGIGPLVVDEPVVPIGNDHPDLGPPSGFGPFSGAIPYPESFFAPYTAAAAATGSSSAPGPPASLPSAPGPGPVEGVSDALGTVPRAAGEIAAKYAELRNLGIDEEPTVGPTRVRGMRVSRVVPGSLAEKAGLRVGDVIQSVNGYVTEQPGHLSWVILNAASDHVLSMNVLSARDGQEHAIRITLP